MSSHNIFLSINSEINSPLDQFEIRDMLNLEILSGGFHFSLTNIGLYLVIGTLVVLVSSLLATNYNKLVSNN
jgi:F-type H+-transporting ATPase subunit a